MGSERSRVPVSRCLMCGYSYQGLLLRCLRCGGLVTLEYSELGWSVNEGEASIWRYSNLLPEFSRRVSLGEGLTPVRKVGSLHVKLEIYNPTGSYADRASAVLASYLASVGVGRVLVRYAEENATATGIPRLTSFKRSTTIEAT